MKNTKKIISICLAMWLLFVPLAPQAFAAQEKIFPSGRAYSELPEAVEEIYEKYAHENALMAAVFDTEGAVYEGYFGYADKDAGLAADEDAVLDWGSVTKLTVWVGAMQLWEQGLLNLDADIREYLPDGFLKKLKYDDPITMIDLMNHTAGFEETSRYTEAYNKTKLTPHAIFYRLIGSDHVMSLEEYLSEAEPNQVFRPGEVVAYSNYGATLAGYIIERLSGEAFYDYARRHIFEPLGMEDTAMSADLSENDSVRQRFYNLRYYDSDGKELNRDRQEGMRIINAYPAGRCVSTLRDLMTFARALALRDSRLLSEKGFAEFFSPSRYYTGTDAARNCHGLWVNPYYSDYLLGHGGNTLATADLEFAPQEGVGVVVLTNTYVDMDMAREIRNLLFHYYEGEAGETRYYTVQSRSFFHGALRFYSRLPIVIEKDDFKYVRARRVELKSVFSGKFSSILPHLP